MEYTSLLETALVLFRAVLYTMAYICAGGVLIALLLYSFLACSEIFFSQPHSRARVNFKVSPSARPIADPISDVSTVERSILPGPERLERKCRCDAYAPMTVAATLEGDLS
jgi:hypothetical protein